MRYTAAGKWVFSLEATYEAVSCSSYCRLNYASRFLVDAMVQGVPNASHKRHRNRNEAVTAYNEAVARGLVKIINE